MRRRSFLALAAGGAAALALPARGAAEPASGVLALWLRLTLELVRHTPTLSPPVASRVLALVGLAAWEARVASGAGGRSLAGQLNGLAPPPASPGAVTDAVLHGALAAVIPALFANTGPTGQRALKAVAERLGAGRDPAGLAAGQAVGAHLLAWAAADGGAEVDNLGFARSWPAAPGPAHWVPTNTIALQQAPLLPRWGQNRPFAMPAADACPLPPPPEYSETPGSPFHAEALEVWQVSKALTDEQRRIARFWSDDAMLSPTPPGHWVAILMQIAERDAMPFARQAEGLVRLGVALADAFIACWRTKYAHDLLRPVTYIRRVIEAGWEPYLTTPPFPEYPSGHSTQSGAAAAVLTAFLGEGFAFEDATHAEDGIPPRRFASFRAAAEEAALSRLYGGIHFRSAMARGLEQGACVGAHAVALSCA
jgi:membrane-associated phospholipid phosphatase